MARPREFDIDTALEQAMQTFWARGYKATSLDDLCVATGLSRSSLYAAFGGKRAMLHRSIERYESRAVYRIGAALKRPVPIRVAVGDFVQGLIDRIVAGPGRSGCFIGNCAAEVSRQDRETAERVRQSLLRVESVFHEALSRARERGELPAEADIDALARFLVAGIQGLRLIGKANPDRRTLEDTAAVMLKCLEGGHC